MSYYFRANRATKPNDIIALPPSSFNPLPSLHVLSALRYLVCLSVFLPLSHSVSVSLSVSACPSLSLRLCLSVSLSLKKTSVAYSLTQTLQRVPVYVESAPACPLFASWSPGVCGVSWIADPSLLQTSSGRRAAMCRSGRRHYPQCIFAGRK